MKKIIISSIIAAVGMIGVHAEKPVSNADSLGYILGASQGAGLRRDVSDKYNDKESKAYRKAFMKGVKDAVLADTVMTGYSDGLAMGQTFLKEFKRMKSVDKPANIDLFVKTLEEFYMGEPVSNEKFQELLNEMSSMMEPVIAAYRERQERAHAEEQSRQQAIIDANLAAGKKFIENLKATDKDVVTTPSGLVYKVIKEGDGPKIGQRDSAVLNYSGKLVTGKQFDANQSVKMSPTGVIRGFGEGLQLMSKGAHYILYIPADLAYGMQGPPVIGPAQTLIFDVEIQDIIPEKQ